MFKALKHLSKSCKLLSKGLEHMFQAFEHKMHRGRNYFPSGAEKKTVGFKKILFIGGCGKICGFSCVIEKLFIILQPLYEKTRY